MYETHRVAPHPSPTTGECCIDPTCESGLKNNYFEGKRLTVDSFQVEQRYHVERRRLLNRAIHGWGVVNGYAARSASAGRLEIGAGLALDQCGRELVQAESTPLALDQVMVLDEHGARIEAPRTAARPDRRFQRHDPRSPRTCWLLRVHYAEQPIGPQTVSDPCSCKRHEWDRVCETVRYSIQPIDCDRCCDGFPCELECRCSTGPCCETHAEPARPQAPGRLQGETRPAGHAPAPHAPTPQPPTPKEPAPAREPCPPFTRGGCQCLCEHLTSLTVGGEGCCLYEIEEPCGRVRVDLTHGVPLACVQVVEDDCDRWVFGTEFEACGPRRLVKRNDVLFDLIRGCDLTRIRAIGWARWHRADTLVEWTDFASSFGSENPPNSGRNVTRDYWVEFSRPVRAETVRADCFSMTILIAEDEAGWWESRRVPILDIETSAGSGVPSGLVTRATIVVDADWVRDATVSRKTIFNHDEALVEIEVFGDYIVDCNGQTVDANVRGLCAVPSGNGTPGGTLRSNFRVEVRDPQVSAASYDTSGRRQGA